MMIIFFRKVGLFVLTLFLLTVTGCYFAPLEKSNNPYNLDLISNLEEYKRQVAADPKQELVNIEKIIPGVVLDIRYATKNNFTGSVLYEKPLAYARKPVAEALKRVQDSLAVHARGLKIYDAYRPYSVSVRFYEVYPDTNFVANPRYGSRHNRGCAVDVSLVDLSSGNEVPMPTEFDDFSERAHPEYMDLPEEVIANRGFLFSVMRHFGFTYYATEWWHFDFGGWEEFPLMDLSFRELESQ